MFYMTVEELMALLPSVFTQGELESVGYSSYTHEDLKVILGRSEGFLDELKYKGRFKEINQRHSFPRVLSTGYVVEKEDERVQKALCCIVYDILKSKSLGRSRLDLIRQGVKSISTGGVSESYGSLSEIKENEISKNYAKYLGFCLFKGIL